MEGEKVVEIPKTNPKEIRVDEDGWLFHKIRCDGIVKGFTSYCGYDRGPKRHSIIKKMLEV